MRTQFSLRIRDEIMAKVEEHRSRMQAETGEAVKVTVRAALEDLLLKGLKVVKK
jgi:hypothetical protein